MKVASRSRVDVRRRRTFLNSIDMEQLKSFPVAIVLICSQNPAIRALAICHIACKHKIAIFTQAQGSHFNV